MQTFRNLVPDSALVEEAIRLLHSNGGRAPATEVCACVLELPDLEPSVASGLVAEDVVTTGGSTRETIEALRAAGALVVGAASIIDRSGGRADVGVPRVALATLDVPAVSTAACALCAESVPAVKPGSRKQ